MKNLKNLVTDDKSWLLFKNVKGKKVCVSPGVSPRGIPKDVRCKMALWFPTGKSSQTAIVIKDIYILKPSDINL